MKRPSLMLVSVAAGSVALAAAAVLAPVHNACAQQTKISFAEDIVPIFKGYCLSCHQPGGEGLSTSGLDLTSYDGVMKGTKFGPMIIPGQPDNSNIIVLIEGRAKLRMPYGHKALPNCLRNQIWTWIFQGAKNN